MRKPRRLLMLVVVWQGGSGVSHAWAQACEVDKLLADDGATSDHFGYGVDADGDVMIVGAPQSSAAATDAGAAYVFRFVDGDWTQEQRLTASDAAEGDRFGHRVAVDGDVAVISATNHDGGGTSAGAAYVFHFEGGEWIEQVRLEAPGAEAFRLFGSAVDVSGSTIAIGSPGSLFLPAFAGRVDIYLLGETGWMHAKTLAASDADGRDQFGIALSLDGDTLCIGANENDDAGSRSGSAYVFHREAGVWGEVQKLTASDAEAFDEFGWAVALDGQHALIGAYRDDDAGGSAGAAYAFGFDGAQWTETQKLVATDVAELDQFGFSLDLDGGRAVIAAWLDDDGGDAAGAVYRYALEAGVWNEREKLVAHDPGEVDEFGRSVAVTNQTVLIGAWLDDDLGDASGSAYVFALDPEDTDNDEVPDPCDNCPLVENPDQLDCDENGHGDACVIPGDFTADGVIDLADFAAFADCTSGPDSPPSPTDPDCMNPCLDAFDFDNDGDVDLPDFAALQTLLSP